MLKYIGKEPTSGDSLEVRKWYYANVHNLQNQIDRTKPIEEQARQGFELRNAYKTKARACMSDKEAANDLELSRPIKSFEELV